MRLTHTPLKVSILVSWTVSFSNLVEGAVVYGRVQVYKGEERKYVRCQATRVSRLVPSTMSLRTPLLTVPSCIRRPLPGATIPSSWGTPSYNLIDILPF